MIDPATGEPAFSGLAAVTALAPTTAQAEAVAKAALLSGRDAARELLMPFGGVIVDAEGRAENVGELDAAPVVRLRMPARVATGGQAS